jgi:hypothetical protein
VAQICPTRGPSDARLGPLDRRPDVPARWDAITKLDDSGAVWDFIENLRPFEGAAATEIAISLGSTDGFQNLDYSDTIENGYTAESLKALVEKIQTVFPGERLRMTVGSIIFLKGQSLMDWLQATRQQFRAENVRQ